MGFWGVIWKNNIQKAYLPKISIPGQIVFEILAQLFSDDLVHNIGNQVKFRRICMESSEQNGTSICYTIHPTMLLFGKYTFQMLFFENIPTNPIISNIYVQFLWHHYFICTPYLPGSEVSSDH